MTSGLNLTSAHYPSTTARTSTDINYSLRESWVRWKAFLLTPYKDATSLNCGVQFTIDATLIQT